MIEQENLDDLAHFQQQLEEQRRMDMKDNTLVLFPNDKGDNPKRPDFTGKGLHNGVEFQVSVWNNTSKAGRPYMSGQIQAPYNGSGGAAGMEGADASAVSDDVPF
jgi:uncharacterized protein (DUF736 family)